MGRFPGSSSGCASILEKIQRARTLHLHYGDQLLARSHIRDLLSRLRQSIDATQQSMFILGIMEQCRHCDEEGGGSCCGAGIENKYSVVLLLINLFLGGSLPQRRYDANGCFFAGEQGCTLKARHVLCVNYLCSRIERALPPDRIIMIQRIAGNELECLFMLHEAIKKFINSETHDQLFSKGKPCSGHPVL